MTIIVELPDHCKELAQVVASLVQSQVGDPASSFESAAARLGGACERAFLTDCMRPLALDADSILVDGIPHARTVRARGSYYSSGDCSAPPWSSPPNSEISWA